MAAALIDDEVRGLDLGRAEGLALDAAEVLGLIVVQHDAALVSLLKAWGDGHAGDLELAVCGHVDVVELDMRIADRFEMRSLLEDDVVDLGTGVFKVNKAADAGECLTAEAAALVHEQGVALGDVVEA